MKELEFYLWSHVLLYMYNHDGEAFDSMKICSDLHISSTSSVTVNTKLLEQQGLITIKRDGRYNKYVLTKGGLMIAEHLNAIFIGLQIKRKK